MKHVNLGQLMGEITLFGGPYSNLQAVNALLEQSEGTTRICTGDLVAYCGAPRQSVQRIRASGAHIVAGNCEQQLAANALDCGCGFDEGTTCDLLSAGWYSYANAQVDAEARAWMGTLPECVSFAHAGRRYAVIHGGLSDVARFIWSVSPDAVFEEEIDLITRACGPVDRVIAGHSGIAFARDIMAVQWINAGVIGMPPHDGTRQTEYVRLDADGQIHFEKLSYDANGAAQDMQAAGLTIGYHDALLSGIWPSEDVLPAQLRRM